MHLAKKHRKKGPRKKLVHSAKAVSACAEAVEALKVQDPKGRLLHAQSNDLHCSPLAQETCLCPYRQESQALLAKVPGRGSHQCPVTGSCSCGSYSGSQRCPGTHKGSRVEAWRRKWQPSQYACPENPMDRGAWRAPLGSQRVGHN